MKKKLQDAIEGMQVESWEVRKHSDGKRKVYVRFAQRKPVVTVDVNETAVNLAGHVAPPVNPPTVTDYLVDQMPGGPINMNGSVVDVEGSNLATVQKVQFYYLAGERPADEPFYEKAVTPGTDTSFSPGTLNCETVDDSSGFFRVVTAGGESEFIACSYAM